MLIKGDSHFVRFNLKLTQSYFYIYKDHSLKILQIALRFVHVPIFLTKHIKGASYRFKTFNSSQQKRSLVPMRGIIPSKRGLITTKSKAVGWVVHNSLDLLVGDVI
jgi:hypothetical protein